MNVRTKTIIELSLSLAGWAVLVYLLTPAGNRPPLAARAWHNLAMISQAVARSAGAIGIEAEHAYWQAVRR